MLTTLTTEELFQKLDFRSPDFKEVVAALVSRGQKPLATGVKRRIGGVDVEVFLQPASELHPTWEVFQHGGKWYLWHLESGSHVRCNSLPAVLNFYRNCLPRGARNGC